MGLHNLLCLIMQWAGYTPWWEEETVPREERESSDSSTNQEESGGGSIPGIDQIMLKNLEHLTIGDGDGVAARGGVAIILTLSYGYQDFKQKSHRALQKQST